MKVEFGIYPAVGKELTKPASTILSIHPKQRKVTHQQHGPLVDDKLCFERYSDLCYLERGHGRIALDMIYLVFSLAYCYDSILELLEGQLASSSGLSASRLSG